MPGPPPKPSDQRVRRNRDGGTTSTSVVLPASGSVEWLDDWPGDVVEVVRPDGDRVSIPAPPARLLKATRALWVAWWVSPEASVLRPQHVPALRRLMRLYDQEERLQRRVDRSRIVTRSVPLGLDGPAADGEQVVEHDVRAERIPGHLGVGSQGQIVQSPDFAALMKVREEVRALEDRFGGSPMSRFRLGWQQAAMTNEQARAREALELSRAAEQIAQGHRALVEQTDDGGRDG